MGKIRFLWDNLVDGATITASSSAAGFPATNLQHSWHLKTHRTTGVAAENWVFDLGTTPDPVQYFVWYYHNLENDTDTVLKIQANATNAWGAPSINENVTWNSGQIVHFFSTPQTYRYWRFYVENPGNPDGYLRCGRPYLGSYLGPTYNFLEKTPRFLDPSELVLSSNRQLSANTKDVYRAWSVQFDTIIETDLALLEDMFIAVGLNFPWFVIFDSADNDGTLYYVRNTEPWEFPPYVHENYGFSLSIEEDA